MATMGGQVLRVNREKLVACMTCPICNKLFRDATTISECLHSFCRKCIYEKITEEDLDSCPVCNTDFGCAPLEKLRADHNLVDLRFKIFPSRRQNSNAPEAMSSIPLPARRRERSLSSLVVSTSRLSIKSSFGGRRCPKKNLALQEHSSPMEELVKDVGVHQDSLSSPETLSITTQNKRQIPSTDQTSSQHTTEPDKGNEDGAKTLNGKDDLWKPLSVLVDAASKTKFNKSNSRGTVGRPAMLDAHDSEPLAKAKSKECANLSKVHRNENYATARPSGSVKPIKSHGQPGKASVSGGLNARAQAVVDTSSKYDKRFCPIWFSLVAAQDQEGDAPLPQISSCYLRVKDGSLPVSFIKKYLVKKLDLASEAEVEISLRGQSMLSTWQLHSLVTWWVQTSSASERVQTSVGSSAKDFVMVLSYGRKA